ncbi:MAG: acetyl-CoA acetyltransferase [Alphaproteobacteria bacterium]|nr:acetyl-CoA acetyltransferase [Alphaproteobacteria bacterium]MBV9693618.1 acetyl-CoA acetyltransferase [Alphaproteobacteria bacterium]
MSNIDPRMPILVGGAQFTQRTAREGKLAQSLSPIDMLARASRGAFADAGIAPQADTVAVVRFTADSPGDQGRLPKRMFRNPPLSLAKRLDVSARRIFYTATGGNTPQWLVNRTAEEIARGECEIALLAGAEYIATLLGAMKQGVDLGWANGPDHDPGSDPEEIGDQRAGTSEYERRYGLHFPVNVYPLFENALRGKAGRTPEQHLKWLGEFFSPFSKVASENPHAWFPMYRTPDEISTPSEKNRFVGYPYTKYLNAVIEVDQAAAVLMTSVAKARELGIAESKWVYLHGCADANDIWHVGERVNYHSSPAIREIGRRAFGMAAIGAADLAVIDLYSCFPSAVQIGCAELGIATDDPRGLTVTGGLPYFGGAGNDYVMHAIVTMMERLRARPGAFGLCTGNGWYVTKHSAGIYSTKPKPGRWERDDPKSYQQGIDAMAHPAFVEQASGPARVETYTVVTDRKSKRFGIVVGRDAEDRRFLAHTPDDDASLDRMMQEDMLGRVGDVTTGPTNLFRFA